MRYGPDGAIRIDSLVMLVRGDHRVLGCNMSIEPDNPAAVHVLFMTQRYI